MDDLNDLYYFEMVVQNRGFSAAARAIGVEKTRLSRRVAALEQRLGVRLLQRTTRTLALTEAGARFHAHCAATVEGAAAAYDSMVALQREPTGTVRMSCPQVMAQAYLAPLLPAYLATHPKVNLEMDASDRAVNIIEERFDLALRSSTRVEDTSGLVAREVGRARRVLVASPAFLSKSGQIDSPQDLAERDTICRPSESQDGRARWIITGTEDQEQAVTHVPRMLSDDLLLQLKAAIHGVGIALLPEPIPAAAVRSGALEHVLPNWAAASHLIFLLYPKPRGMLPSVRSLIDYLLDHLPNTIKKRSIARLEQLA